MPGVYEHTRLPATHFPAIVPVLEGRDDVQHSMMLSLHHRVCHHGLWMLYKNVCNYHLGLLFFLRHSNTGSGIGLGSRGNINSKFRK